VFFELRVLVASPELSRHALQLTAASGENVIVTQTRVRIPFGATIAVNSAKMGASHTCGRARALSFSQDCTVCCRPNLITVTLDADGAARLEVTHEA
jgi:Cysteine-rich CPXCG